MKTVQEVLSPALRGLSTREIQTNTRKAEEFPWNFELVGNDREREQLQKMLSGAIAFCSSMQRGEEPRFISFLGVSGVGKTHLAKRITDFFESNVSRYREPKTGSIIARRGGFKSWRKFADELASGEYDGLRMLEDDWFVALDDIGSEYSSQTGFSRYKLDHILSERVGKRWTVITSNLSLSQWAEKDVRIASRLKRGCSMVVECTPPFRDYCYRRNSHSEAA